MRTIDDIQSDLRALAQELEQMKKKDTPAGELNLQKISAIAARYPIKGHPLAASTDVHKKKNYLIPLLAISQYAGDQLEESLLYAHRIAHGMRYLSEGQTLQGEYLASMTLSFDQLDECAHLFQDTKNGLMLVLEMLITAGSFTSGKRSALEYAANMCMLLKLSKEEVTFLGNMAAVILTRNPDDYKCKIQNTYAIFDGYLADINFQRKLIYPKCERDVDVAKESYTDTFTFLSANVEFHHNKTVLIYQCTYWRLVSPMENFWRRSTLPDGMHETTVTQNVIPCTYLLKPHIASSFDIGQFDKASVLEWIKLTDQMAAAAAKVLSEPIGVQTHPLDSVTLARQWFEEEEKKIQNQQED